MVDDDEVAVAAHPAGVDDRARTPRRAIGVPYGDADVDALVHAAPAPAEAARDRAVDRPDEPARRGALTGRARLRGADLRGELRRSPPASASISCRSRPSARCTRREAASRRSRACPRARSCWRRARRGAARTCCVAHGDDLRASATTFFRVDASCSPARPRSRSFARADLVGDPLVLRRDSPDVVEPRRSASEKLGDVEQDVDRRRLPDS